VFDEKPVLLGEPFTIPTPALDTRHARDTFTMVFGNKKKSGALTGALTFPRLISRLFRPLSLHSPRGAAMNLPCRVGTSLAVFQVYRMVKLQTDVDGRDSGSPDIYEIEFPSAADLNRVEEL
jgi:hypothetical protein